MNKERVKQLIQNNRLTLSDKEKASLNLIEMFEIVEHISREVMGDDTPVKSCLPIIEKPIKWMLPQDFANKYPFINWATLYHYKNYDPDFRKIVFRLRGKTRLQWHLNQKLALEFFIKQFEEKDCRHLPTWKKMKNIIFFMKSELQKL